MFTSHERPFRHSLRPPGARSNVKWEGKNLNERVRLSRRHLLQGVAVMGLSSGAALVVDGCTSPASTRKMPRVGVLSLTSDPSVLDPFRQGLRELGHVPDENITIVYRYTMGSRDPDLARTLVTELIGLNPDVIVTGGNVTAVAAQNATTAIPIVAVIIANPVGNGLVAS